MNENVKDLIDAIEAGKAVDIETAFEKVMSDKVYNAIEDRRAQLSYNLLGAHDRVVEDEEPPVIEPDDQDEESHGF